MIQNFWCSYKPIIWQHCQHWDYIMLDDRMVTECGAVGAMRIGRGFHSGDYHLGCDFI